MHDKKESLDLNQKRQPHALNVCLTHRLSIQYQHIYVIDYL